MKKVIIGVLVALVAYIGFGFTQATSLQNIQIVKSVTIKGSKQEVFDMVRYLNNFPNTSRQRNTIARPRCHQD